MGPGVAADGVCYVASHLDWVVGVSYLMCFQNEHAHGIMLLNYNSFSFVPGVSFWPSFHLVEWAFCIPCSRVGKTQPKTERRQFLLLCFKTLSFRERGGTPLQYLDCRLEDYVVRERLETFLRLGGLREKGRRYD